MCNVLARVASLSESKASLVRYLPNLSRDTFRSSVALSMGVIVPPFGGGGLDFLLLLWMPPIVELSLNCR